MNPELGNPSGSDRTPMRDLNERRSQRRRSVFLRAKVYGADGAQITECAILDTSRSGCKIISEALDRIPEWIVLAICGLGEVFTGRLVWRKANMAGIEFIQNEAATAQAKPTRFSIVGVKPAGKRV